VQGTPSTLPLHLRRRPPAPPSWRPFRLTWWRCTPVWMVVRNLKNR